MASLRISCGGDHALKLNTLVGDSNRVRRSNLKIARPASCRVAAKMSTTTAPMSLPIQKLSSSAIYPKYRKETSGKPVSYEKLDEWMRGAVTEIVKRLPQSPLLVSVYDGENGGEATLRPENAAAEGWEGLKSKWETEAALPEGIIFVEELGESEKTKKKKKEEEGEEKAWGIVVQGRRSNVPACYLLKTSRVASSGFWCTHFCLTKVKSFREGTKSQLQNCWLVNGW